ncbi:NADH:flavin oxidoreductase [Haloterrigena salifodinae]|uniref:NADH:flavin oxidoreductase n=1 Tax=Haloterrigena salifodinae TaxID=2675099 RepID=A0A8T8DWJ9_9EURY|nr:NADH:flavin oxidoreductase [Haloterrigena salifodinae]QRV13610.1 NADH:flavin oxidoreductase [Haloterrigena salifodinae]
MNTSDDSLFESVDLGDETLPNRVGLAPMTRTSATADGRATAEMARYYAKFARGSFSFLITEGTYPDEAYSQGYDDQPGIANDDHVEAWRRVTDAVHDEGAPIFAQLMHAGALSQGNRYTDERLAPSAVRPKGEQLEMYGGSGEFPEPRAATADDIEDVIETFVAAAERAVEANFDGVEVHGANGYLLDQFLTTYTNERDDEYGGDVKNRIRLTAEVLEAVQAATPDEFVVGVRISQSKVNDPDYRWPGGEDDAAVVFETLSDAGADYLHVTEEDVTTPAFESGPTLTELANRYGDAPVIANGALEDPDAARATVAEGADLITLAKGALANPDWPQRVAEDRPLADFDFQRILQPDATIDESEVPEPADADD